MGRYRRSVLAAAALLTGAVHIPHASADTELAQAQERFRQGEAYFKVGAFDKAIVEYEAAYALVPKPGVLFNIGLCHENAGNKREAASFYERFLREAPNSPKASEARARREALLRDLDALEKNAETKEEALAARRAGQKAMALERWQEATDALARSYALVPEPEVLFELAEAYRLEGDENLAEAEYRRYLATSATGTHRREAGQRLKEIAARRTNNAPVHRQDASVPIPAEAPSVVPSAAALSATGVFLTLGIVYGLRSSALETELADDLRLGTPPLDTGDSRIEDGQRAALVANISYAAAGVGALVSAYFVREYLTERKRYEESQLTVRPLAGPQRAGMALEVTF